MSFVLDLKGATHGWHRKAIVIVQIDDVLHGRVHKSHQSQLRSNYVLPVNSIEGVFRGILEEESSDVGIKLVIRIFCVLFLILFLFIFLVLAYLDLSDKAERLHCGMARIDILHQILIQVDLHSGDSICELYLAIGNIPISLEGQLEWLANAVFIEIVLKLVIIEQLSHELVSHTYDLLQFSLKDQCIDFLICFKCALKSWTGIDKILYSFLRRLDESRGIVIILDALEIIGISCILR